MQPLGVLGAVIGAIAIGTAATSTSTTTIILTGTTISIRTISTAITLTEGKAARVTGNITRNTEATRLTAIGERQTSSAATIASSQALVVQELAPELAIVQAVVPVLAIGPAVALEPETGLVEAQAQVIVPAVAALVLALVVAAQVLVIDPAEVQALAIGLVVAQVLEIAQAEVPVPETVQVEAVREHAQGAVPQKTRSATAAHPRVLVEVLRAADLAAAAAETMPEQAATEAATAWAAAG